MSTYQIDRIEKEETKLVGYSITESLNHVLETRIVGILRENLAERKNDIKHRKAAGIHLIQIYPCDGQWTFDVPYQHVVAFEVSAYEDIPADMMTYTLPPGQFIKIVHRGAESEIGNTYEYINQTFGERPLDIEYWSDIHSLDQSDSQIDILIPAK
ncbi:Predicted transcriptional regulator YdeE, contains AraC-type DNA-binding domain [Paenibacillus catalpae]|uniref:Predicted transcriptional regulator YdeE, contains AraC-type DNA-binding domain n=1 Tax=Paenibacillus catalpae TaxID=1045775 RepID=A0A1I1WST2_9BACL|nr:effector binding domain-containing protein [Paenibacillus catalpae]SFD98217.1 Predicted transcriptional regulator YdeE, contains AraC-type DNA-binding domain [Paenibacillus catalpae]